MWLKELNKIFLRASTLTELLVVMVVTSILLLTVTDGLNLFRRYSQIISNRIAYNSEMWDYYCRLEALVSSADSLQLRPSGDVAVYKENDVVSLSVRDSMLFVSDKNVKDTLFRTVAGIDVSTAIDGTGSLVIVLPTDEGMVQINFTPFPKPKITSDKLKNLEDKYRYD